jgi:hypothetical protein
MVMSSAGLELENDSAGETYQSERGPHFNETETDRNTSLVLGPRWVPDTKID